MTIAHINVLTYHSISGEPGPTSIPDDVFRSQLQILQETGYTVVSLDEFAAWRAREIDLDSRSVVVTFDDGFANFADHAFPALAEHGWSATVFLPVAHMGAAASWRGAGNPALQLLSWRQVTELAAEGIDFGSHSMTHSDLRRLGADELRWELQQSRDEIAQRLHRLPLGFAPPYGQTNRRVRDAIRQWYPLSVGTRLRRASRHCDLLDIPRIEMHYFRDLRRWRAFLEGREDWYFFARQALRGIRTLGNAATGA